MPVSKTRKPRQKKPVEARVQIVLDDECIADLDEAVAAVEEAERQAAATRERRIRAMLAAGQERPAAESAVDVEDQNALDPLIANVEKAEQRLRENTDTYVFRAMGRARFHELIAEHPPSDEYIEQVRKETGNATAVPSWEVDKFAPALIAACCVQPDLTQADADTIWAEWNQAECDELFMAALGVNQKRRSTEALGKAHGPTRSAVR